MSLEGFKDHIRRNQAQKATAKAGHGLAAPKKAKVRMIEARIILMVSFISETFDTLKIYNYSLISKKSVILKG